MITRNKSVKCLIGQRENVTLNVHGTFGYFLASSFNYDPIWTKEVH